MVRALRENRTQTELGGLLGNLSQAAISAWENGQVDLSCEQVLQLEHALGVRPGTIGMAAGYVEMNQDNATVGLGAKAVPRNIMRIFFQAVDEAIEAIQAAEILDLGVRLWNARVSDDPDEETYIDRWVVEIWDEPVEDDHNMVVIANTGAAHPRRRPGGAGLTGPLGRRGIAQES